MTWRQKKQTNKQTHKINKYLKKNKQKIAKNKPQSGKKLNLQKSTNLTNSQKCQLRTSLTQSYKAFYTQKQINKVVPMRKNQETALSKIQNLKLSFHRIKPIGAFVLTAPKCKMFYKIGPYKVSMCLCMTS